MKPGDLVRIKDNQYNSAQHRGLICIVLKVEKSVREPDSGLVCVIQSATERCSISNRKVFFVDVFVRRNDE